MQTTDQVAGEAREKLADEALARIADEIEQNLREHPNRPMKRMLLTDEVWSAVAAALRAQPERGAEKMREAICYLPEDLHDQGLVNGVRTLAWSYQASHNTNTRWGSALRLLLPFVHEAACYGMLLKDGTDDELTLDAENICIGVAGVLGCELGDAGWEAMLSQGRSDIRALPLHPAKDEGGGR